MVRVVGNTDAPPPIVTDFGSNPDAVIGCGLTVGVPDTPVPAHAGPAYISPIADTPSAPSRRNFLMHHPPHVAVDGLVLAPLLRLEAAKVSGYLQGRPGT